VLSRNSAPRLRRLLAERPAVFLHGARQVGKTTLARALAESGGSGFRYVTFDDLTALAAAQADPEGFLAGFGDGPLVFDEVQRVPGLFLPLKAAVDRDRRPGRFLLTGSANLLVLPRLSDALVGRMAVVTLWPLSQGETGRVIEGFVDALFGDGVPTLAPATDGPSIVERVLRGGFPEAVALASDRSRDDWCEAYVTTLLSRDIRDLAQIEGLAALPRLLALVAARPMALLNRAELARSSGIPQSTLQRYLALLEAVFLVRMLPPWHANLGKRLVKSPKLLLTDSGLAAHLMGLDAARVTSDRVLFGGLLESFVANELTKQLGWSDAGATLHHLRSHGGEEVDFVLETRSGRLAGIEVKSAATVSSHDFRGLRTLAEWAGPRFHRGIVLHAGTDVVPFGERLFAMPIEALWRWGARASS
jgi:predicted AAA+ superfamily ATPase